MAVVNGTGQGGKTLQDREKAAKVRNKGLDCLLAVLEEKKEVNRWGKYKKDVVLKLAGTLLPRINEHTGEGGEAIIIKFDNSFKNDSA